MGETETVSPAQMYDANRNPGMKGVLR